METRSLMQGTQVDLDWTRVARTGGPSEGRDAGVMFSLYEAERERV